MIKKLATHTGFKRYFKNTSWLLVEKVIRMFLGLIIGVLVARYLGPDEFGTLNYVISLVGIIAIIGTFGLDGILIRNLVKDESKRDSILGTAFWLRIFGSFLVFLILYIVVSFTSNDSRTNFFIYIIAGTTIFSAFNVIDFYFQAKVLSKYIVKINILGLFISSGIKIIFILMGAPLIYFIFLITLDSLFLMGGFIYIYVKQKLSIWRWTFDKSIAIQMLKDGWPLIISFVMISVYMKLDQVMIHEMLGNDAVGQYAAGVRLSTAWYFIPSVIASSFFPAIINAKKIDNALYYSRLQKMYNIMIWLAIFIAVPMTFFSDSLIILLYGDAYVEAGTILMIHIWAGIFVFANMVNNNWYMTENKQLYAMVYTSIGAVVNIVLNYIFILNFGIVGAAIATIISYFVASYLCLLCNIHTRQVFKMFSNSFNLFHHVKNIYTKFSLEKVDNE